DVGVHAEDVGRVPTVLEGGEPLQAVAVGGPEAGGALVRQEVDVHAGAVRAQGLPAGADPGRVALAVGVAGRPAGGEADVEADLALADGGGAGGGPADRPAHGTGAD